jgi:hypothetical protein
VGQMFFRQRTQKLYMRSDAHGERAQKVYALDYCAASFVTEGELPISRIPIVFPHRSWQQPPGCAHVHTAAPVA